MQAGQKPTLKVIGAGYGRTGTSSLRAALVKLGFDPCYHMKEVIDRDHCDKWIALGTGQETDFETVYAGYQATVDNPGAGFYKELMEQYPDAKVILSVREPESWYKSCEESIFVVNSSPPNPHRTLGIALTINLFPFFRRFNKMLDIVWWDRLFDGRYDREYLIKKFIEHNEEVKRTVPPERLLVYEVKQGWEPLCKFLGVPVPDEPFPHENDRVEFQKFHRMLHITGNAIIAGAVALVGVAIALGVRWARAHETF